MIDLLTVQEVSEYLKRSPGAVRMLVQRNLIPFRRCAGRLNFLRSEIDDWIQQCEGARVEEAVKANGGRSE
jgi:excisionase family DNA binding protein